MAREKILSWLKQHWEVIGLIFLSVFIYFRWIGPGYFVSSDWQYTSANSLKDFFHIGTWSNLNSFGKVNLNLWRLPIALVQGIFGFFGFDTRIADKAVFFFPIIFLVPLASYFYAKRLSDSRVGGVAGSLFFSYNTYFLAIGSQGHIGITISSALVLCALLVLEKWRATKIDSNSYAYQIYFAFIMCLIGFYDFRFVYILGLILFIQLAFLFLQERKEAIRLFFFGAQSGAIYLLLNLFWLIPFVASSATSSGVIFSRALWRSELFTLSRAVVVHQPFWNPEQFIWHHVGQIPFYLWIPILLVLSYSVISIRKRKDILLYLVLFLFGVFLSKQEAEPFNWVYRWLFVHLPGFGAFREASKFYLITLISLTGLSAYFARFLFLGKEKRWQKLRFVCFGFFILIPLLNASSVLRGKIDGIYLATKLPSSYQSLLRYIEQPGNRYRILWIPEMGVNWGIFNQNASAINYYEASGTLSDDVPPWLRLAKTLSSDKTGGILRMLRSGFAADLLAVSNIRYVILPKEFPGDTKNPFRIEDRDSLKSVLDTLDYLKEVTLEGVSSTEVTVYELKNRMQSIFSFTSFIQSPALDDKILGFASTLQDSKAFFLFGNGTAPSSSTVITRLFSSSTEAFVYGAKGFSTAQSFVSVSSTPAMVMKYRNPKTYTYKIKRAGKIEIVQKDSGMIKVAGSVALRSEMNDERVLEVDPLKEDEVLDVDGAFYTSKTDWKLNGYRTDSGLIDRYKISPIDLKNGDFESGLWESHVRDCNRTDDKADLNMRVERFYYGNNSRSLALAARTHAACTKTSFKITEGNYLLHIKHQSPNAEKASYYLGFDGSNTKIREEFPTQKFGWGEYWKEFSVPHGTTSGEIYLYAKSTGDGREMINRYDDVKIYRVASDDVSSFREAENEIIPVGMINQDTDALEYVDPQYSGKQLLTNASFEEGFWQEKVGDCNRYDDSPQIAMRLNEGEKTDGKQSLELEVTRHVACTTASVPVRPGATYRLSFDYQSPNARQASYYIGFNNLEKTALKKQLQIIGSDWQHFSDSITVPKGATTLSIYLYAREEDGVKTILNRYDHFSLQEVPDLSDAFYVVTKSEQELIEPKLITYETISATKRMAHVSRASTAFFLGMSESYHDKWMVEADNKKTNGIWNGWSPFAKPDRVANELHYKLNGFLNAWYVDVDDWCVHRALCKENPDGTYDMDLVIEFWPQRWLYFGLLISGSALVSCLSYLAYRSVRNRRRRVITGAINFLAKKEL